MSTFAPPWTAVEAQRPSKRTKRVASDSDDSTSPPPRASSSRHGSNSSPPDSTAALPHSFPHKPLPSHYSNSDEDEDGEGAAPRFPPFLAPSPPHVTDASLLKRHVGVVNAILHTSLLRGDYARAGHAFALLLRLPPTSSASMKLRANGHWGIGAEILLHRPTQALEDSTRPAGPRRSPASSHDESGSEMDSSAPSGRTQSAAPQITSSNFAAAKSYYESLILRYPYSRMHATAVDARTFYPAYFSLRIYEASTATGRALADLAATVSERQPVDHDVARDHQTIDKAGILRAELSAASAIAKGIDDVVASPPYDRFEPLLRLRLHVARWSASLARRLLDSNVRWDEDDQNTNESLAQLVEHEDGRAKQLAARLHNGTDVQ